VADQLRPVAMNSDAVGATNATALRSCNRNVLCSTHSVWAQGSAHSVWAQGVGGAQDTHFFETTADGHPVISNGMFTSAT